jgi:hypothetical protein
MPGHTIAAVIHTSTYAANQTGMTNNGRRSFLILEGIEILRKNANYVTL